MHVFQIEREREEHLRPMLHLTDAIIARSPSQSSSEDDHPASPPKEESEEEPPEEKYPVLPNMKPTLQPVDESSQSSLGASADDEASRLSMGMNEESQHPPSSREDSRLGFGAMKLGKLYSICERVFVLENSTNILLH